MNDQTMSKMPAKKKSCFQITSVTQAQAAACSLADDADSLDDPDESRTEDVSSEVYDVSRADADACERSSSEETLNNAGDPQEGAPPLSLDGAPRFRSGGRVTPLNLGGGAPFGHPLMISPPSASPAAHAPPHPTPPVGTSCSSRFRVIKLDHGTGEPFRRGRWTCTEFYERDSDAGGGRAVEGVKPVPTLDHLVDRDGVLGAAGNSIGGAVFPAQASEPPPDGAYSLGLGPRLGSGASAFQPTGYAATQASVQPAAPQNFHSNGGVNGVHHGAAQASPITSPAAQAQHRQQHFGSSAPHAGVTPSRVPSPLVTSAGAGAQGLNGECGSAQGLLLQGGNAPATTSILQGSDQHASPAQQSGGLGATLGTPLTNSVSHSSGENAPATVPNTAATSLGGGSVQPQGTYGGVTQGLPSGFLTEDSTQKSDFLPPFGANMVSGRDNVKPFIGEGLGLPTPSVKSLFGISIAMNVDEDR